MTLILPSLSAHLSKDLIKKYKKRSFPLRKGDEVEIMRGEFKKKKGKISKVDLKKSKVYIEGINTKKVKNNMRGIESGKKQSAGKIVHLNKYIYY